MDIDRIQSGDDFVKAIKAVLDQTGAVLVVMGRIWNLADVTGKRRLDDQEDYVRLEIMTALSEDIQVIPVLVQGAEMPKKEDLPPELRSLLQFNAAVLADERWGWDTQRLAKILELDVPGSLSERRFKYLKNWILGLILISVSLSSLRQTVLLRFEWHSISTIMGLVNPIVAVATAILLPLAAPSADSQSKKLMWASAALAGMSVLLISVGFELYVVITNAAILVLLNLSSFKPR